MGSLRNNTPERTQKPLPAKTILVLAYRTLGDLTSQHYALDDSLRLTLTHFAQG